MVSVLCAVCGSYGGRVVRRTLLGKCPGTPPPWRQLALRDVLLGFPSALHDLTVFLGKFCVPSPVHVAPGAHSLRFCPAPLLSQQRCSMF